MGVPVRGSYKKEDLFRFWVDIGVPLYLGKLPFISGTCKASALRNEAQQFESHIAKAYTKVP